MNKMRLTRDKKWFFQYFPYHQMYMDNELVKGWVAINYLTDGETRCWEYEKSGKVPICGKGMIWLTIIPENASRCIGAYFLPNRRVSVWYIDVIEDVGVDEDGVVYYLDKYLDVILTPQGDICIKDRDELDAAYESGELSSVQYEAALREGERIIEELASNIAKTEEFCIKVLERAEEMLKGDVFTIFSHIEESQELRGLVERTRADLIVITKLGNVEREDSISPIEAIKQYLEEHPRIKRYVILADCYSDCNENDEEIKKHLVFMDALKGLQKENLLAACEIMNMQ